MDLRWPPLNSRKVHSQVLSQASSDYKEEENICPCKSAGETAEKVKDEQIDHQQKKVDRLDVAKKY